jgi:hypothetical protein
MSTYRLAEACDTQQIYQGKGKLTRSNPQTTTLQLRTDEKTNKANC